MSNASGEGQRSRTFVSIVLCLLGVAAGQQCSNESFSIGYNGVTAFEVSNTDNSCRCAGPVTSQAGISHADTLSVNNLVVVNSASMPCPSSCQAQLAMALAQIAQLNATLQAGLATMFSQGCSGGGGGGGGGSFCVVVNPANGDAVGQPTRVVHGATITYTCNNGFNLTGYATQTCVGGAFDHALPVCAPLPCTAVPPPNGAISASTILSFSTVTYSCNSGYQLNGTATQLCYATRFNDSLPNCVGLPCTSVAPDNGNVSASLVPHGSSAIYSCASGYTLSGPNARTCTATVLNGSQPVCNGNPCPVPSTAGVSTTPSSGSVAHNSSLVSSCGTGYTYAGGPLSRLCFAGVLGGVPPTCTPNPCTTTAPTNGAVTATSVPHGASVTYSCNSGYTLSGTATQTCNAGSMSDSLPTCPPSFFASCDDLLTRVPGTPSGTYSIDPDGLGPNPAFSVYCDMSTSYGGVGGWTLVAIRGPGIPVYTEGAANPLLSSYSSGRVSQIWYSTSTFPFTRFRYTNDNGYWAIANLGGSGTTSLNAMNSAYSSFSQSYIGYGVTSNVGSLVNFMWRGMSAGCSPWSDSCDWAYQAFVDSSAATAADGWDTTRYYWISVGADNSYDTSAPTTTDCSSGLIYSSTAGCHWHTSCTGNMITKTYVWLK